MHLCNLGNINNYVDCCNSGMDHCVVILLGGNRISSCHGIDFYEENCLIIRLLERFFTDSGSIIDEQGVICWSHLHRFLHFTFVKSMSVPNCLYHSCLFFMRIVLLELLINRA